MKMKSIHEQKERKDFLIDEMKSRDRRLSVKFICDSVDVGLVLIDEYKNI